MDSFDRAIEITLKNEGAYVNNPLDNGGPTNLGISLRFLKGYIAQHKDKFQEYDINVDGIIDAADIKALSLDDAKKLYKAEFWDKNNYSQIVFYQVAAKIFDLSVNMGAVNANKCAQRAVRAVSGEILKQDGIIGPASLKAINECPSNTLLAAIKCEAAATYLAMAKINPQLKIFLNGWLNRCYS